MYLLAHLAAGALVAHLGSRWWRSARLDVRWILLGAILPDLVDKPLGLLLGLPGRTWTHTALISSALTLVGVGLSRRGSGAIAWLAIGMWTHLLLDEMWRMPMTLLYPAYGVTFPPDGPSLEDYLRILVTDAVIWVGEIVGAIVLAGMAWRYGLRDWRSLRDFLLAGKIATVRSR